MKAILLAAGKSSRMWPLAQHKNKCMYEFLGKPLIIYTLEELKRLGLTEVIIVVSAGDTSIKEALGTGKGLGLKIEYAVQKDPKGTGDAILSAKRLVKGPFVVANATKANLSRILAPMIALHKRTSNVVLSSRETDKPWKYGVIRTQKDRVLGVIEKPAKGTEPGRQKVEGVYLLVPEFLSLLEKAQPGENSLEETLQQYLDKKQDVRFIKIGALSEFSLKYSWDMLDMSWEFLSSIKKSRISKTAKIHKSANIEGNVIIEDKVVVYDNATIKGPCYIGEGTIIGKNAQVRESSIGRNCVIGFGTDVKSSILFDEVKADMCYIGDTIIDEVARLGAGTITANRRLDRGTVISWVKGEKIDSGREFFGSVIGKDAKTGIHVGLMPGTKIGVGSLVWPHVVVLQDIPDSSVAMLEAKTIVKPK